MFSYLIIWGANIYTAALGFKPSISINCSLHTEKVEQGSKGIAHKLSVNSNILSKRKRNNFILVLVVLEWHIQLIQPVNTRKAG